MKPKPKQITQQDSVKEEIREAFKRLDAKIEQEKDDPLCWMKPIAWKGLRLLWNQEEQVGPN